MTYNINDIINVLSEYTYDNFFDIKDYNLFVEKSDTSNEVKKSSNSKFKNVVDKASKSYIDGMTKRSNYVANKMVKKPPEGSSKEIQEKYEQKVLQAKATYKVGEILTSSAILIGPLDLIAKAAIMNGLTKSDDPADKMVLSKFKMLSDKANDLKNKVLNLINKNKGKPITENEFKKPYEAIQLQGMNIAKEIDATKVKTSKTVTESVLLNKFDMYLIKEDGTLVDNAYDILKLTIEKTDYTRFDIFEVVDHYINMMI